MSLLTACQACIKETGVGTSPSTIISNTDATAVQLNALAERAAKYLMRRNWQKMVREHTITTVATTATYALPSDWARYISETAWDATNYWPMRGSLDPQMWTALKRGIVTIASGRKQFRVYGNLVQIIPTPDTSDESLIIEYLRNTPWTDSTGVTYRTAATADADITVFPEVLLELELIWRWKREKGLSYADERKDADDMTALLFAQDTPAPIIDYGTSPTPPYLPNVPESIS